MKTVYINGSPKKKLSASAYFADVLKFFTGGRSESCKLRTKADGKNILPRIEDGDRIVFSLPLYVDGIPSHVLYFLKEAEQYFKENNISVSVYVIANNGFIEGRQNEPMMQVFENFCTRSGIKWGGGIGVGGGVMLNVYRIVFTVQLALLAVRLISCIAQGGEVMQVLGAFAENAAIVIFLNIGVFFYCAQMGAAIRKGGSFGKKYTRAMLPSFVFIICADIFFIIISIFSGGIFRGWLAKKKYEQVSD